MIHQFWRLQEGGEHNLGLAITGDGLVLGRTPLIEQRDARFVVREQGEIERLLSTAYQGHLSADRLMSGLATVAAALNANDHCLARIAAVHLKIPDLPNSDARNGMEVEDVLIKLAGRQRPAAERGDQICKASPDDPEHPGWPKGNGRRARRKISSKSRFRTHAASQKPHCPACTADQPSYGPARWS